MTKVLSYLFLLANLVITTWGVILLGGEIGSSWWSASFFYVAWASIPCVILHFGITRFGKTHRSQLLLALASLLTLATSGFIVWTFIIKGPISPLSMLIYLPFPLTQFLLIVPFIWLARRYSYDDNA